MFDGLVAFVMDRWRHDCGARRVRFIISRSRSPMSEGRFDLTTFRSERTNKESTLTITPKRSSSRDVGTSSYRYHTATSLFRQESRQTGGGEVPKETELTDFEMRFLEEPILTLPLSTPL
ncbi:hypothetical protein TNCV_2918991 [Trichonephila clavipes]|nr:hypothetical protein TNCV_2918991 [Trichonephila clavipes]